jgi:predicted  nucleic acid-binding Zn-ribbon protein
MIGLLNAIKSLDHNVKINRKDIIQLNENTKKAHSDIVNLYDLVNELTDFVKNLRDKADNKISDLESRIATLEKKLKYVSDKV